jgi:hypothetical protein
MFSYSVNGVRQFAWSCYIKKLLCMVHALNKVRILTKSSEIKNNIKS